MNADSQATTRELRFIPNHVDTFLKEANSCIAAGTKKIALYPPSPKAKELMAAITASRVDEEVELHEVSSNYLKGKSRVEADVIFFCHEDADEFSPALMDCLELERGIVVAPITERYFRYVPLFLISIPKAGTHLLYKLVETFGYAAGVELGDHAQTGTWYCVEYSNSHTSARNFFIDTVRRSPFGNRHHPFMRSPALFIYRNPLDILVSEANYYHKDGNTAFAGYLSHLAFEDRLSKLIDDPWLFGSYVDRIGQYAPWLDIQNVIPVSFEELIGPGGGGNQRLQENLIWSLQLKLQVPGSPEAFAEQVFDRQSPTFFKASIGSYRDCFTAEMFEKFHLCDKEKRLMRTFGYAKSDLEHAVYFPDRAEEFRRRKLILSNCSFDDEPICIKYDYLGFNIIQYKTRFYGIPITMGAMNVRNLSEGDVLWREFPQAGTLAGCKQEILLHHQAVAPRLIEEGLHGFNIVFADGLFYGVRQSLGEIDFAAANKLIDEYPEEDFVVGRSPEAVRVQITQLIEEP